MAFVLVRCDADGQPLERVASLAEEIQANCLGTAALYRKIGYVEPWVGYIAVDDGVGVGGGAFVGAPRDGRVEIAYYTLTEQIGKGYGTRTATGLMEIARKHDPRAQLIAHTLQEENASTRILQKLGFAVVGTAQDPDAGEVWEWRA